MTAQQLDLFEAIAAEDQVEDEWEPEACSCRFCGIATTVPGLARFEHGPAATYCARMVQRYGPPQKSAS